MTAWLAHGYLYSVSGLAVGMLVGLTGVGGGSLMTPLLVLLFGFHPSTAVGTDLLFAAGTKTVGTAMHGWRETVDWRVVRRLAAGSAPGAVLTLLLLSRVGIDSRAASHLISIVLGVALLLTAASVLLRPQIVALAARYLPTPSRARVAAWTVVTGGALGILVTLSSVGAGAVGFIALLLLYPRLPMVRLVASDIAHAVPLTLIAGAGHWLLGSVDFSLLGELLVGSVPGILAGSYLATRAPDPVLRPVLAATLMLVGGKLIM